MCRCVRAIHEWQRKSVNIYRVLGYHQSRVAYIRTSFLECIFAQAPCVDIVRGHDVDMRGHDPACPEKSPREECGCTHAQYVKRPVVAIRCVAILYIHNRINVNIPRESGSVAIPSFFYYRYCFSHNSRIGLEATAFFFSYWKRLAFLNTIAAFRFNTILLACFQFSVVLWPSHLPSLEYLFIYSRLIEFTRFFIILQQSTLSWSAKSPLLPRSQCTLLTHLCARCRSAIFVRAHYYILTCSVVGCTDDALYFFLSTDVHIFRWIFSIE